MILSRISKRISSAALLRIGNPFRFTSIKNFEPNNYDQMKINRVEQEGRLFKDFFEQNKSLTTQHVLLYVEKAIQLIEANQQFITGEAISFVKQLNTFNFHDLNYKEIDTLLRFMNRVQNKLFHSHIVISQFKSTLASKLKILLQKDKVPGSDISLTYLINFYYYLADDFYSFNVLTHSIIPLLFQNCYSQHRQQNLNVSFTNILIFLRGYQKRSITTIYEKWMRTIFLAKLKENLDNISTQQLTKVSLQLNRMDQFDFEFGDNEVVSAVFKKLTLEVPNLELKQIKQICSIQGKKYNKITLLPVYKEILSQFFTNIEIDGTSDITDELILHIFTKSSNKLHLGKYFTKEQQQKFYAFMNRYIINHKHSQQHLNAYSSCLTTLIKENFLKGQTKEKINFLLKQITNHVSVELLYTLDSIRFDIQPLFMKNKYNVASLKFFEIINYSIILKKRMNKKLNTHEDDKQFQIAYARLVQQFNNIENFTKSLNELFNYESSRNLIGQITEYFPEIFSKLPNPFQMNPQNENYTFIYLDFIYKAKHKPCDFITNFKKNNQDKINSDLIFKIIHRDMQQKKNDFLLNRDFLKLLDKKLEAILVEGNRKLIRLLLVYLQRWVRLLVKGGVDQYVADTLWKIFLWMPTNKQTFKKLNLSIDFVNFLYTLIGKVKNYQTKPNYKQFILFIFTNLNQFSDKISFQGDIVKQCFRMNMVTKENCSVINADLIKKLNKKNLSKYKTLTDETYIPNFDKKEEDLELLVYNPRTTKIIQENMNDIVNLLNNCNPGKLESLIINFNHQNSKTSLKLSKAIMKSFIAKKTYFDQIDVQAVFKMIINNNWYRITETKQFFKNVVKFYSFSVSSFTNLDSRAVFQLIKFAVHFNHEQELVWNQFFKLIQSWLRSNYNLINKSQVIVQLLYTNFDFKPEHLLIVYKMIEMRPKLAINFFLYLEDQYSDLSKKEIVQLIVEKIKTNPEQHLLDWFYLYLKEKYPELMKEVHIDPSSLPEFVFSNKPSPSRLETFKKIAEGLNIEFSPIDSFGKNQGFKFNQKIIFFVHPSRVSKKNENFIRKAIKVIRKIDKPIFFIDISNFKQIITTLQQGQLLTSDQIAQFNNMKDRLSHSNNEKDEDINNQ